MIFIYDILVNMNENLIDFYDWEETDTYEHIRRGCLIKILSEDYYNLLTKTFKIDLELMNQIKDNTQKFSGRNTILVDYQLAFTDGINAFMVKFDKNGVSKLKSKFLVNEELEIISITSLGAENTLLIFWNKKLLIKPRLTTSTERILRGIVRTFSASSSIIEPSSSSP